MNPRNMLQLIGTLKHAPKIAATQAGKKYATFTIIEGPVNAGMTSQGQAPRSHDCICAEGRLVNQIANLKAGMGLMAHAQVNYDYKTVGKEMIKLPRFVVYLIDELSFESGERIR